jgi:hypothetical protein
MADEKKTPEVVTTADIDKLIADSGVKVLDAAPSSAPKERKPEPQGGAFVASDGRTMFKYSIGEDTIVLPKPLEQMSEEDFYQLPISVGDPLSGRLPQTLTVKFRDPQWAGHWFNRKAQDGRRVSEARALGFIPATRDDVEWVAHSLNDADGAVIDNDLVLMKIHKAALFLKYKGWMDLAKAKGSLGAYKAEAEGNLGRSNGKVEHYFTKQAEREMSGLGPVVQLPVTN